MNQRQYPPRNGVFEKCYMSVLLDLESSCRDFLLWFFLVGKHFSCYTSIVGLALKIDGYFNSEFRSRVLPYRAIAAKLSPRGS